MKITDGLHLIELFKLHAHAIRSLRNLYPEVETGAMNYILADVGIHSNLRAVKNIARFLIDSLFPVRIKYRKCDAVFFNSSNKSSFGPAINELVARLTKRGIVCSIVDYDLIRTYCLGNTPSQVSTDRFYRADNIFFAFYVLARGMFVITQLLFECREYITVYKHLRQRVLIIWLELAYSYIRSREAERFFSATCPKLFLTHNEKIPIANEMVVCCRGRSIATIYYFCEHPDAMVVPVYSKEVWVWSDSIKNSLMDIIREGNQRHIPPIAVVGHHEADLISRGFQSSIYLDLPVPLPRGRKLFVFISEYVRNLTWQRGPPTRLCVQWLSAAANAHPDWLFVFKGRPYQSLGVVPGFEMPEALPENLVLYLEDSSLLEFLSSGRVSAAGALGSLGLYAAAQSGIPSFRFKVTDEHMTMPFLDDLSVLVNDQNMLINGIGQVDSIAAELKTKIVNRAFRGCSLNRIEALATMRLDGR